MSDPKLKAVAGEALSALAEAVGPQFVATQLHKKAAVHKSPKVRLSCHCGHSYYAVGGHPSTMAEYSRLTG